MQAPIDRLQGLRDFARAAATAGVALRATDTDWTAGSGREVSGTALSLLLLLTGRTSTAVGHLHGPGVARLSA
ncbi:MAG: hypothetical protein K0Q93_2511 [Nocardioidaceae bacterium]|nr:hypothetical protein [Nocardioidaceae bacterium]